MPKQPVLKNRKKIEQPIIIKLTNLFDKQHIYKSLKNLKLYYNELNLKPRLAGYIYVTDHLPIHYSIKPDKKAKERHGKS